LQAKKQNFSKKVKAKKTAGGEKDKSTRQPKENTTTMGEQTNIGL
jgi:hypothetical protein